MSKTLCLAVFLCILQAGVSDAESSAVALVEVKGGESLELSMPQILVKTTLTNFKQHEAEFDRIVIDVGYRKSISLLDCESIDFRRRDDASMEARIKRAKRKDVVGELVLPKSDELPALRGMVLYLSVYKDGYRLKGVDRDGDDVMLPFSKIERIDLRDFASQSEKDADGKAREDPRLELPSLRSGQSENRDSPDEQEDVIEDHNAAESELVKTQGPANEESAKEPAQPQTYFPRSTNQETHGSDYSHERVGSQGLDSDLLKAVKENNIDTVRSLLDKGVDVNAKDKGGRTALMLASRQSVVRALLAAGADVNERDNSGVTALMLMAASGKTAMIQSLLSEIVDAKGQNSWTALIWAAAAGKTDSVKALLAADANAEAKADNGVTALMAAATHGHTDTVVALIAAEADVDARSEVGATPLMVAAFGGHTRTVEALLAAGADEKLKADNGETALMAASKRGHASVIEFLKKGRARD